MKHWTQYKRVSAVFSALVLAGSVAACGGPQNNNAGSGDGNATGGGGRSGGPVEQGPTEEEIAAMRAEQASNAFEEAGRLYEAGSVGDRDYARIASKLEEALENDPELTDAIFNLGVLRYEQGDESGAIEYFERADAAEEGYGRGAAMIGYMRMVSGDEAGAEQIFNACIESAPLEPGCNINLSIIYRQRALETGDDALLQQAIDRLRFALGGDANSGDAYANLARAYFDQGRMELARLVCENAILQGVDDAVLHNRLGLIALAQDDVITAYQEFQAAVARRHDYVDAQTNIGAMALSFRDYAAAREAFEVVLAQRPDDLGARLSYGVALRGVELFDEAEAEYCAVLAADPDNLDAVYNLGLLFEEYQQDYELAISFYNYWQTMPGASSAPQAEEVPHRATVLADLMDAMMEMGEYTPPGLTAQCAP